MYYRKLTETVLRLAKAYQVIGITGPRQSGKTTLAKHCFPNLPYLSFENIDTKERERVRNALLEYCEKDTASVIELLERLRAHAQ